MKKLNISLSSITRDNWKECIELDVQPKQKNLVGANIKSLAESSVRPESTTLAIYNNQTMVGFMMYLRDVDDGYYYIHRFMVDAQYQNLGIGYLALKMTLEIISKRGDCKELIKILFLTFNEDAERLYIKIGFKDSGQVIVDEKLFYYEVENK
jgi:diamine N-acetyltransferase